jgi:hypothetical protein
MKLYTKKRKILKNQKCNKEDNLLRIKIEENSFNYIISQTQLINDILQKFKVINIRKAKTPYSGIIKLSTINKKFDKTIYKSVVGSA